MEVIGMFVVEGEASLHVHFLLRAPDKILMLASREQLCWSPECSTCGLTIGRRER
jgi:hypothetical protein